MTSLVTGLESVVVVGEHLNEVATATAIDRGVQALSDKSLRHVLTCPECRAAIKDGAELTASRLPRSGSWVLGGVGLAAAVALLLVTSPEPRDEFRTDAAPVQSLPKATGLLTTTGPSSPRLELSWTATADYDLFEVTVFDSAANVVSGPLTVRDTFVDISITDAQVDRGLVWQLRARKGWGRWVELPPQRITEQEGAL